MERIQQYYFFPKMATVIADYIDSCPRCQKRKITKHYAKNKIISNPTPDRPFSVWEVDLYGPLPCTEHGNKYIFTALDMFSRFLFTLPLPNKDACTVSEALFQLMTQYGVCDTLISDQGKSDTGVTQELCRMLNIPQQFTPLSRRM